MFGCKAWVCNDWPTSRSLVADDTFTCNRVTLYFASAWCKPKGRATTCCIYFLSEHTSSWWGRGHNRATKSPTWAADRGWVFLLWSAPETQAGGLMHGLLHVPSVTQSHYDPRVCFPSGSSLESLLFAEAPMCCLLSPVLAHGRSA